MNGGLAAREIKLFVWRRNGFENWTHILIFCKAGEVRRCAFVPAKRIAGVFSTPAEQARAPRNRTVHERLLLVVPDRVGCNIQCRRRRIDVIIRRFDHHFLSNGAAMVFSLIKNFGQIGHRIN